LATNGDEIVVLRWCFPFFQTPSRSKVLGNLLGNTLVKVR
jgi:hypothetical protein